MLQGIECVADKGYNSHRHTVLDVMQEIGENIQKDGRLASVYGKQRDLEVLEQAQRDSEIQTTSNELPQSKMLKRNESVKAGITTFQLTRI